MERGEPNYLSKDWEELSEARNLAFKEELVYESRLSEWLSGGLKFKGQPWDGQPFSTDDALHFSGCRDRSAIEQRHKDAAADALRSLGFKHKQIRQGKFQPWKWVPVSHNPCHMTSENLSEKAGQKNEEGLDPSCDTTHGAA